LKSSEPVAPTTVGIKERILYIRQEAAKLLSISVVTSDRLFAKKLIEAGRVGRRVPLQNVELMKFSRMDKVAI
jgi:hypothetical protein